MYEIPANTSPPAGAVILLHGWGANGKDLVPLAEALRLPQLRYVALEGEVEVPLTGGYGKGWFMFPPTETASEEIASSRKQIVSTIDRLVAEDIPPEKIILMGFSQGGSMALNVLVKGRRKVGCVVVMSGFFLNYETIDQQDNLPVEVPIFAVHGTYDNIVPMNLARDSLLVLDEAGFSVEWHEYPCEHRIVVEELQDIRAFIEKIL